jgi:predicted dehydrogenase
MKNIVRWGILSTAKIGRTQVIPAMQKGEFTEVAAIASNDLAKARQTAGQLGIPKSYGSYDELLADADIDAVYIPLPNHLHVPYTLQALKAGKHVLCEKPIALNADEAAELFEATKQYPHLKVMEAFMYRFHPQWLQAKQIVDSGTLGQVKHIQAFFSYYNIDAGNIRNKPETGGGALMDIGCYCVSFPRFIFGSEPGRVVGLIDRDPVFKTDTLTSGLLDFGEGKSAAFTCSTQLEPYQRVNIIGAKGRLEIEIPCNAPIDAPCKLWLQRDKVIEEIKTETANQYTLQGDAFSRAILDDAPAPTPLVDAVGNMRVIDAIFKSAEAGGWVNL